MCLTPKLIHHPIASFDLVDSSCLNDVPKSIDVPNCDYVTDANETDTSSNNLNILQFNIRGLVNKQDDLRMLLNDYNIDIVLLCETWLNDTNVHRVDIPGFNLVYKNRESRKGGGVCILLKNNLKFREYENKSCPITFEVVTVELKTNNKNLMISSAYRPPSSTPTQFVHEYTALLNEHKKNGLKAIVGMDHNLDLLKSWSHKPTQEFLEKLYNLECYPAITKPTRITNSTATLIDNIFLDIMYESSTKSYILIDDLSDHLPCIVCIEGLNKYEHNNSIIKRKLSVKKLEKIRHDLSNINWNEKLQRLNTEQSFSKFHDLLSVTINAHAPLKEVKVRNKSISLPWITKGVQRSINKLKKLYQKSIETKKDSDIVKYKEYRTCLNRLKRRSKVLYYKTECVSHRNNSKKLWELINKISGKITNKNNIVECLSIGNLKECESKKIANEFAEHFANIGKKMAKEMKSSKKNISEYLKKIHVSSKSIYFYPVTETEINRLITNLPNKTSSGHDNISNVLIKDLKNLLLHPLNIIFNKSLTEGVFPEPMKRADVIPLHKGKRHDLKTNYRPISLLLTISKILEKIVHKRTYNFLDSNDLLYNSQYGFRSNYSCEHAVGELISKVLKGLENSQYTIAIYLDLSKAFDTISHKVLLNKLSRYGIRGKAHDWFKHYLSNRKMRSKCIAGDPAELSYSEYHDLDYGAPQGSCLGPLLFMIFVNDLYLNLTHSECILFADDTTIYMTHRNLRYLEWCISDDLENISDWFNANFLTLNLGKTVGMLFSPKNKNLIPKITIGDNAIPIVKKTKFLGIWIDEDLSWNYHVNELCLKIKRNQYLLRKSKNILPVDCMKMLYYAQIYSHLAYGIAIWGSMLSKAQQNRLQKIQTECIRLVLNKKEIWPESIKLGILSIKDIILLELNKLGYKLENKMLPSELAKCILSDQNKNWLIKTHKYSTRNKAVPNNPKPRTSLYHNSFLCKSITEYQSFMVATRHCKTLRHFSACCKRLLHERSQPTL